MKRLMIAALCAVGGYLIAAVAGYLLTMLLSSNMHDRAVEAAMAGAFVWGPLGAVAAFMAGWWMA
ncbi:MAG: hypothetical protein R3E52_16735 [Burkholderiaceae bacterium]